jgi:sec-independent protein translocase protein TatA
VNLGAPELLIILLVILVLFGGAKLPKLARSLGQAQKEFKDGQAEANATTPTTPTTTTTATATPPPPPVQSDAPEGPIS